MNYSNFIAALDIGGSKITLTLATRTTGGEINILDSESIKSDAVKYGRIINENTVANEIKTLILKVHQRQNTIIEKVYVTTGGSIISSITNTVTKELDRGTVVTSSTLDELRDASLQPSLAEDEELLEVKPLSFKADGEVVDNIVGLDCHNIEATYLIIKGKKDSLDKIKNTLKAAEVQMADMFLAPIAIAESTLTDKEKAIGTAAIEIGKSTTKIAIYQGNKLRFATTIPLGGHLITSDLSTCLNVSNDTAELLTKHETFGAVCSNLVEDADIKVRTTSGTQESFRSRLIVEIIEARMEEILQNIYHQIERSNFTLLLSGGLVISGGMSEIKNLTQFVKITTNFNARIADIKSLLTSESEQQIQAPKNAETCGMFILGDLDCKQEAQAEEEEQEQEEEQVIEEPVKVEKKKKGLKGMMGNLFDLLDENDEQLEN